VLTGFQPELMVWRLAKDGCKKYTTMEIFTFFFQQNLSWRKVLNIIKPDNHWRFIYDRGKNNADYFIMLYCVCFQGIWKNMKKDCI